MTIKTPPKVRTKDHGMLMDYRSGESIRHATKAEASASKKASKSDGGTGVINVNGRYCYVV